MPLLRLRVVQEEALSASDVLAVEQLNEIAQALNEGRFVAIKHNGNAVEVKVLNSDADLVYVKNRPTKTLEVRELSGRALDWAVHQQLAIDYPTILHDTEIVPEYLDTPVGAEIADMVSMKYEIEVIVRQGEFYASALWVKVAGHSSIVAVLRWYVAYSNAGKTIEIPAEYA